jgi:hypothetical protein
MNKGGKTKAEYDKAYGATTEQKQKRAMRNQARREAIKDGKVTKGDGKDVDHKQMLDSGGTNTKSNLRVVDETTNRGWRKNNGKAYGK